MGVVYSLKVVDGLVYGFLFLFVLWVEDNDVFVEVLVEVYGLGLKGNLMMKIVEKDKVNYGFIEGIDIGKYVVIDCEMVGVGFGVYEFFFVCVSIVDFYGCQIYDLYVK